MKLNDIEYCVESAVIASLIKYPDLIDEVTSEIKPEDFSKKINCEIYTCLLDMQSKNELTDDFLTICDKVSSEHYDKNEIFLHVGNLLKDHVFGVEALKAHIIILKNTSNKRKIMALTNEVQKKINSHGEDVIEFLRKGLENIENNQSVKINSHSNCLDRAIEQIERSSFTDEKLTGVSTGFHDIDKLTSGLQNGDLIILAARPSMGKTALALNIAQNISAIQLKSVAFFSLEMTDEQIAKRTLCRFAKIESDRLFSGKLTSEDWEAIQFCKPYLDRAKLFINDRSMLTVSEMRAFCRKVKNNYGLSAIFVDYISFVQVLTPTESEVRRLALISSQLKAMAKDFNVPVVVLSQLNRNVEARADKRPVMSDIRDSGAIEQDADMIIFLYRDEKYNTASHKKGEAELIIEKNRNGKTGVINLRYNLSRFEFMNYDRQNQNQSLKIIN